MYLIFNLQLVCITIANTRLFTVNMMKITNLVMLVLIDVKT
jgi:formate/nitrite transporter FocA (FNT family)